MSVGRGGRRAVTTDRWAIDDGYEDVLGTWRETSPETRRAIVAAMGGTPGAPPPALPRPLVIREHETPALTGPADVQLEDGAVRRVDGRLPADLPLGYHELRPLEGAPRRLIVGPPRCHLPPGLRAWGWAVQLYAARSRASWGIGDLADLARLGRWSASRGARLLLVNPLHAATPVVPQEPSPYYPSSRRFLNPLYLRIEDVPGADAAAADLDPLVRAGLALNAARRIERDRVLRLKVDALERVWSRTTPDDAFERYWRERGRPLDEFAAFCALAERHGRSWRQWPAEYRRPDSPAVARFAAAEAGRVRFHAWLQWLLDAQLERAARELRPMQDLPIGVDPDGADAWTWQDVLAAGVSIGAPPDRYNAAGQDWGLPPFVPQRLAALGYEPFIQTIRATLRHAGGLRVDHVMGLFRLFWIPRGTSPAHGAYVRYPADDLLAILALESRRAGAIVVGEDLGTVEPGVRERLAEHAILSYRVVWFESQPPARYPALAMAAVTTHDLPTVAGLWTGSDAKAQRAAGLEPNEAGFAEIRARLRALTGLGTDASIPSLIEATYRALGVAPSALAVATLEDALALEDRPNMPGTSTERPNWSLALPVAIEDLETHPLAGAIAAALGGAGR